MSTFLFVYGTLLPGEQGWRMLEPFVGGQGTPDSVRGELFDTGLGYPAATLDHRSAGVVRGRTLPLISSRATEALQVLDEFEDVAEGFFRRVIATTDLGLSAWVYVCGVGFELTSIPSGEWSG